MCVRRSILGFIIEFLSSLIVQSCGTGYGYSIGRVGQGTDSQGIHIFDLRRQYVGNCNLVPVVVNGYEAWSVTLREKHRLRVCEYVAEERIWV